MTDFATVLADTFDVVPSRETGLVVDAFDSWSVSAGSPAAFCLHTSRDVAAVGFSVHTSRDVPVRYCCARDIDTVAA